MDENGRMRKMAEVLPGWFPDHARDLPWRKDREPYHVWLSEIMLQQTRVEAVKGYYTRFLAAVPDVPALAAADPELLHKLWEGLGYYSRVRNLQAAAKQIMAEHGGSFPSDYASVRALKGIGEYTAGAICSICFEQPTPAVDGNVLRVVTRLNADPSPITDEATKRAVREKLAAVYPAGRCGIFTQSLMELGATVCLPNSEPRCADCPLAEICRAHAEGSWRSFPVRAQKRPRRVEELTVFVLECDGAFALRKRPEKGLLAGLWEFPNVRGHMEAQQALDTAARWGVRPRQLQKVLARTHLFTHVQWQMRCCYLQCAERNPRFVWATREELNGTYALPTAFRMFREDETTADG
jgi:A/G-specific adenine glycosylase